MRFAPDREAPQGTAARPGTVARVMSAEETDRAVSATMATVPEQLQAAHEPEASTCCGRLQPALGGGMHVCAASAT